MTRRILLRLALLILYFAALALVIDERASRLLPPERVEIQQEVR